VDRTIADARAALARCVGDVDHFMGSAWGREVVERHDTGDVDDLLSLDDVDHLLSSTSLRTPAFRLAKDGAVLPSSGYTRSATIGGVAMPGIADAAKVFAQFEGGATIVLQGLHRYWPPLARLVRDLEVALGHPCQVNAYITPPGSQGFDRHSDTHDVFVLQSFGAKSWRIWPPGEHEGDGREVDLRAGSTLYLPMGTPHAARTQDTISGHLTIGIQPQTWRTALTSTLTALMSDASFDDRLPAGFLADPDALEKAVDERLRHLRDALAQTDTDTVAAELTGRFLTTRLPILRGGLLDAARGAALADDTLLRRRPGSLCVVRTDGDQLEVLLGDRRLTMPGWLAPAVHDLCARDQLTPSDLPIDPQSRLVLCRRLVREGLLEIVG
jgi:mannose-6-phosphate isomerase-like protein (cupin superfamily)